MTRLHQVWYGNFQILKEVINLCDKLYGAEVIALALLGVVVEKVMSIKWDMVYGSIMSVELCRPCSRRVEQDSFERQIIQDAFLQIWRG